MNKGLLSHQGAFPRSVLIYGPIDTGKNTMMNYISHQLKWNVLSFNCIDMISSEPSQTRQTILDTFYYCFNRGKTILLFKNLEVIMSLKEEDMDAARLMKTILEAFKEVLQKFHDTENKKILAIFILNGKLSQFKTEGFNLLDNFEFNLKFYHLSIDEIAVYWLYRIQGHVNLLTWKELFEFSYRMKEYT